jgi:hypothetical protein
MVEYIFDLQGYLVLKGAISTTDIAELNSALEAIPSIDPGQWYGYVAFPGGHRARRRVDHGRSRKSQVEPRIGSTREPRFRFGYYPSEELLARLTPERRAIVNPFPFWSRTPNTKPGFRDKIPTPSA